MIPGARVIMWCNYRQNGNGEATLAVPAPVDAATPHAPWWYDEISKLAPELAAMGITDILFPNPVIGEGAPGSGDDGYNPYNDYNIGEPTPTRFGYRDLFLRAVAVCHANGLNVLLDHVMHQRMGGRSGVYNYTSAGGAGKGRFPKTPSCFRLNSYPGGVPEDPVPAPGDDFSFGDELCPVNAEPPKYVWNGLLDAAEWLFTTSGADGARLDDMKGMAVSFMNAFFDAPFAKHKFWFGEYDDGNPDNLNWWIGQVGEKSSATDFAFQENMAFPMCMQAGGNTGWEMTWMGNNALMATNPMKAVTFVSSMDSETDGWATIVNNKTLGLALLLGSEGLPLLYIKDYLAKPAGYGLKTPMHNLTWIHQCLAQGPTDVLYADAKTRVFQRTDGPGLMIALNNDIWNPNWTTVTCRNNLPPGTVLKDYTGKNTETCLVTEEAEGMVTFGIPPAANGNGYGAWAPVGLDEQIVIKPRSTTQMVYGADDLDIGPATNGTLTVARFDIAKGSHVTASLTADRTGWDGLAQIVFQLLGPDGKPPTAPDGTPDGGGVLSTIGGLPMSGCTAALTGWHTVQFTSSGLPETGASFSFKITYTAPTEPSA